jgi:hypothetical protein
VRVRNLGYMDAEAVKVKIYRFDGNDAQAQPADWEFIGEAVIQDIPADGATIASPVRWYLEPEGSNGCWGPPSGAVQDFSLIVWLDSEEDPVTEDYSVALENNIALRKLSMQTAYPE